MSDQSPGLSGSQEHEEAGTPQLAGQELIERLDLTGVPEPVQRTIGAFVLITEEQGNLIRQQGEFLRQKDDQISRLIGAVARAEAQRDAAEREATELRTASRVDALTGLLNRGAMDRDLQEEIEGAAVVEDKGEQRAGVEAEQRESAFFLLDIDHFKELNDTLGHDFGDLLLRRLADAWRHGLRHGDDAYREGGDEFVVIARSSINTQDRQEALAERIRSQVIEAVEGIRTYADDDEGLGVLLMSCTLNVRDLPTQEAAARIKNVLDRLDVSIGFTSIEATDAPSDVRARADTALYESKAHKEQRIRDRLAQRATEERNSLSPEEYS